MYKTYIAFCFGKIRSEDRVLMLSPKCSALYILINMLEKFCKVSEFGHLYCLMIVLSLSWQRSVTFFVLKLLAFFLTQHL
jgi:hypothetical protein